MSESRQSEQPEQPEQPAPANRAERRAQGKKAKATQHFPDQQQRFHGRGGVQSPRQYGRRRSG